MNNNYYITKMEQDLIRYTSKTEIFSYDEIRSLFPHQPAVKLKKSISKLCRHNHLYKLKRGLYYSTPNKCLVIKDPLSMPQLIYPGYLAFSTALRVYNLIEYEPFVLYTVTNRKSRTITLGEYTIKYIALGERATGAENRNGIWVSTLEKTIFDCFYKPQYAGGYELITKALFEQKSIDWDIFMDYVDVFASNSLRQRIGYILDILNDTVKLKIPKRMIEQLRPGEASYVWLLQSGPRRGKRIKEWAVFDNIGQDRILEWWYNG